MGVFLIIVAFLLTLNVAAAMLPRIGAVAMKEACRAVFLYQMALCGVLLLFALDAHSGFLTASGTGVLRAAGWTARSLITAAAFIIVFFCIRICLGGLGGTAVTANRALVLGAALENGQPSGDLLRRLETAGRYLTGHPGAVLILTGGNPDASGRTEAEVMRGILARRGVPEDRMILEKKARTTAENFVFSAAIIDPADPVVLITSGCHMGRAVSEAEKAGFRQVQRLPAPDDPLRFAANMMWEAVLALRSLVC